jgi:hypothetical protein
LYQVLQEYGFPATPAFPTMIIRKIVAKETRPSVVDERDGRVDSEPETFEETEWLRV